MLQHMQALLYMLTCTQCPQQLQQLQQEWRLQPLGHRPWHLCRHRNGQVSMDLCLDGGLHSAWEGSACTCACTLRGRAACTCACPLRERAATLAGEAAFAGEAAQEPEQLYTLI